MRRGRVRWAKKITHKLIKKHGGTLEFLHSKKKHQQQQQHAVDPQVFKYTHAYKRNGEKRHIRVVWYRKRLHIWEKKIIIAAETIKRPVENWTNHKKKQC